jgi:hypothetical protein
VQCGTVIGSLVVIFAEPALEELLLFGSWVIHIPSLERDLPIWTTHLRGLSVSRSPLLFPLISLVSCSLLQFPSALPSFPVPCYLFPVPFLLPVGFLSSFTFHLFVSP